MNHSNNNNANTNVATIFRSLFIDYSVLIANLECEKQAEQNEESYEKVLSRMEKMRKPKFLLYHGGLFHPEEKNGEPQNLVISCGDFKESDKSVCSICMEKDTNAVLMGCGHGNMCLDCAVCICCKNNACPFCRKEIGQIVSVSTEKIEEFENGVFRMKVDGPCRKSYGWKSFFRRSSLRN